VALAAEATRAVVQGVLAALLLTESLTMPVLLVLAAVYGFATGAFRPAFSALVPQLVPPKQLARANGALQGMRGLTLILGAGLGASLIAWRGAGAAVAVDAVTFAASALALLAMRPAGTPPVGAPRTAARSGTLRAAFHYARTQPGTLPMMLLASCAVFAYVGPLQVVGPLAVDGPTQWALLSAATAAGIVGGSVLVVRGLARPMPVVAVCWLGGASAPLLLLADSPLGGVAAGQFLQGAGLGIYTAVWAAELQRRASPDQVAALGGLDALVSVLGMPLGALAAGAVAAREGVDPVLGAMTIGSVLLALVLLASPVLRGAGSMRPLEPGHAEQ